MIVDYYMQDFLYQRVPRIARVGVHITLKDAISKMEFPPKPRCLPIGSYKRFKTSQSREAL